MVHIVYIFIAALAQWILSLKEDNAEDLPPFLIRDIESPLKI